LSKPRPRVQRATGPRLLRDSPQPADSNPRPRGRWSSTLTTRPSRHQELFSAEVSSRARHTIQKMLDIQAQTEEGPSTANGSEEPATKRAKVALETISFDFFGELFTERQSAEDDG